MIGITLNLKLPNIAAASNSFLRRVDNSLRGDLMFMGGVIRKVARRSMRPVSNNHPPSAPDGVPFARTRLLRDRTNYAYDGWARSVVIGPEKLPRTNAPAALEHGETSWVFGWGSWRIAYIKRRAYMWPALWVAQPYMARRLQNSMRSYSFIVR